MTCALPRCGEPRAEGSSFCPTHRAKTQPRVIPDMPVRGRNSALVCAHCQTRGSVSTRAVKVKRGISGGKATGAVLTAGISVIATGLSRKERATEFHCSNCGMTWTN